MTLPSSTLTSIGVSPESTLNESLTDLLSYLSFPGNVTTTSYVPGFKLRGNSTWATPSVTFA